jgi:hypothetical protein
MTVNSDKCPYCGLSYEDFKTGFRFADVRSMLWVASDDYSRWRYKRRNTVLGLWRSIKLDLWNEHLLQCDTAHEKAVFSGLWNLEVPF